MTKSETVEEILNWLNENCESSKIPGWPYDRADVAQILRAYHMVIRNEVLNSGSYRAYGLGTFTLHQHPKQQFRRNLPGQNGHVSKGPRVTLRFVASKTTNSILNGIWEENEKALAS